MPQGCGWRLCRETFNGAALAAELAPQLPGRRVLLPRSDRAEDDLPAALRVAGADVTEVVAYRTAAPERLDDALIGMLLPGRSRCRYLLQSVGSCSNFAGAVGAETLRANRRAKRAGGGWAGDRRAQSARRAQSRRSKRLERRLAEWSKRSNGILFAWASSRAHTRFAWVPSRKGGPDDVSGPTAAAVASQRSDSRHGARNAAHHARLRLSDVRVPGQRRA